MIVPNEHALENAARALREKALKRAGESIDIFRGFRKVEEHRLRMWHHAGAGGREVARQRSDLVDILFKELFEGIIRTAAPKGLAEPLVVTALGGYGRRELTPFSDVDIMFIISKSQPSKICEEVIRKTLMTLWDIGYKVGHSTRSISQTIKQANSDMITRTSLLESRFLSGDRDLFAQFKEHFENECVRGREGEYVSWRLANQAETRARYGRSVFMQEPNVKHGVGGLRDYHSTLWISYFKERINTTAKLVETRFLRDSERRALEKSYDYLLRVRTEMHYLAGRSQDGLTLQLQGRVAAGLNFPQKHILLRVEAFMREYFSHSRNIHLITQSVIERMSVVPQRSGFFGIFRTKAERFDGFVARDGKLYDEARENLADDPYRLIRAFHHAQVRQLNFSSELRDLIRRRLRLVNRTFQYARLARESFLAILSRKGEVGPILREMHDLGFLGRYIPEFGALTCLVQHEFYHRYTADEHTLVCIEKLDGVLFSEEEKFRGYRAIFQKLEDPAMLYLALLLHDTGKATNKRQHEDASAFLAQKVARRLQLSPERRRMLTTLVNSHYEISLTAQKRNLDDRATIAEFAGIVGQRANLDALMLLTLADGQGTSDQNWSDWKEGLVWTLYRRTSDYLEGGQISVSQSRKNMEDLREAASRRLAKDFAEELEAHFEHMPERYFQTFDSEQIAGHIRFFRTFLETHLGREEPPPYAPVFKWIPRPEQGHSEVWVCGWNRPRLLERIAGAFLSAQINILSADVFTRGDNLALDIFRVCSTQLTTVTSSRDIARVETRLCDSLAFQDYDFTPLLNKEALLRTYRISQEAEIPTKIVVDNTSHPTFTLVDIQTPDRLGLLYDLLRALGETEVHIELSRITTEMDVAMDTFYVTDGNGKITDQSAIKRMQRLLQRAAVRSVG